MRMSWVAALAVVSTSCTKSDEKQPEETPTVREGTKRPMLGVSPEKFECDSIVTLADLGAALGGTATKEETVMPGGKNLAKSCNYHLERGAGDAGVGETWTFDFDCRPDYEKRVELMFGQALQQSSDLVAAYSAKYGTGKAPANDAGVSMGPPEGAKEVTVGRRALDHHGQAILFVDDDAPCYVRVLGPGAARRLVLAQLIADHLHEANAPMTPRLGKN